MSRPSYLWRKLSSKQQMDLLQWRKRQGLPWHRPPHSQAARRFYHLTAGCYEHRHFIGRDEYRMQSFCDSLLAALRQGGALPHAWCALPNHYHALVETSDVLLVLGELGRMHGRLSRTWNKEEASPGRQIWCGVVERYMRNDAHYWATLNYVHHNPVRHGYASDWLAWPFSSACDYLDAVGYTQAARVWRQFPLLDYGKGWDDPRL